MIDELQEKPEEATPRGCWARAMSCSGWLLLTVVALALVWYIGEVHRCSRFTPSGDALFDRYARAVIKRQAWRLFSGGGQAPAILSDELLAQWEADFGDDPRYWQLRYWCACFAAGERRQQALMDEAAEPQLQGELSAILEEAIDRGAADARTYLQLYILHTSTGYSEHSKEELAEYQSWLDNAIAADPDYAWPYYYNAMHNMAAVVKCDENPELAQEQLLLGNAAADFDRPLCFPASFVTSYMADNSEPAGNEIVSGAVLVCSIGFSPYSFSLDHISIKRLGKRIVELDEAGESIGLLQEYVEMLCRYGTSDEADIIDWLVISVMTGILAEHIGVDLMPRAEAAVRKTLWEECKLLMTISRFTIQAHDYESLARLHRFWLFMHTRDTWNTVTRATQRYDFGIPDHLEYAFEIEMRLGKYNGRASTIRDRLERIAQFDFTAMQFGEDTSALATPN